MTGTGEGLQPFRVARSGRKPGRKPVRKINEFGRRLRRWVVARGTTNADLAAAAGVDPTALSRWSYLDEEPGIRKIAALAKALKTTIDRFWRGDPGVGDTIRDFTDTDWEMFYRYRTDERFRDAVDDLLKEDPQ